MSGKAIIASFGPDSWAGPLTTKAIICGTPAEAATGAGYVCLFLTDAGGVRELDQ